MATTTAGVLYLVGTPIGNLADLSERARDTLAAADVVAAEDTRRTGRLLAGLGLRTPLVSMFEGNEQQRAAELIGRLERGARVAVVTDGGMPGVSDPGYRVVRMAVERGIDVRVVPGPSAAVAALVVSGLPTDRFAFEGFLPRRPGHRAARLRAVRDDPRTLVVFESPRRTATLLREVISILGDRRVAVCRELTKLHEEVVRGTAREVLASLGDRELRGEVVVVVEGASGPAAPPDPDLLRAEVHRLVDEGMKPRRAARVVAERHGASANELYRDLLDGDR
ncbi:MAG TPA: 16S rRNA (cytidine(1402)-2'-O)-methyltransferase [Actinomycetota bacterium]|nr:16S rRNA (cytidine(1402)-2'-O)-methyltransferase [Actinomycetota bacterium]